MIKSDNILGNTRKIVTDTFDSPFGTEIINNKIYEKYQDDDWYIYSHGISFEGYIWFAKSKNDTNPLLFMNNIKRYLSWLCEDSKTGVISPSVERSMFEVEIFLLKEGYIERKELITSQDHIDIENQSYKYFGNSINIDSNYVILITEKGKKYYKTLIA